MRKIRAGSKLSVHLQCMLSHDSGNTKKEKKLGNCTEQDYIEKRNFLNF